MLYSSVHWIACLTMFYIVSLGIAINTFLLIFRYEKCLLLSFTIIWTFWVITKWCQPQHPGIVIVSFFHIPTLALSLCCLFVCLFVVLLLLLLLSFLFLHLVTVFVSFFNSFNLFYFKSVTINTDIVAIYLHGALTTITCPSMHHPLGTVIERTDLKIAHNNIKVHVYTSTNGQE